MNKNIFENFDKYAYHLNKNNTCFSNGNITYKMITTCIDHGNNNPDEITQYKNNKVGNFIVNCCYGAVQNELYHI